MNLSVSVNPKQLMDVLLNVGSVRPVFIWGAPGIGKSAIVEEFAAEVGLPCVSLPGSQVRNEYSLKRVLSGEQRWPDRPEERDILYFLAQSFRARLVRELPKSRSSLTGSAQKLAYRSKELLVELAALSPEIAQMAITPEEGEDLPGWFVVDCVREIPALARKRDT